MELSKATIAYTTQKIFIYMRRKSVRLCDDNTKRQQLNLIVGIDWK